MKNNIQTILQIIALIFLLLIGYAIFSSGSKWKIIEEELKNVRTELSISKDTLAKTSKQLGSTIAELEKLKLQKDYVTQQRDSFLYEFKSENAVDWKHKMAFKDSLENIKKRIKEDSILLDKLFGVQN